MEAMLEIHRARTAAADKYAYFLLAVAGASIGFAVQKTDGLILTWWLAPVGLATFSWALSFYCGCMRLAKIQAALAGNYSLLQLQSGSHPLQPYPGEELAAAIEGTRNGMQIVADKAHRYAVAQFVLLIFGAICFIGWRVLEMARITPNLIN